MYKTIKELQQYIKSKDFRPEIKEQYYMKLTEEEGELARAMNLDLRPQTPDQIRDTIEEELFDVLYYVIASANLYDRDLEDTIAKKVAYNLAKYGV
jgi:NTP pyrophosphatase (non-canonical NTP hydrolase)